MRRAAVVLALGLVLVPSAGAMGDHRLGFAFGRTGGNIEPYTVRIANDGAVRAEGPVGVGRKLLTPAQIGRLNLTAVRESFARMPHARSCRGVLPDVAYTFIRVGPRTVKVRGHCMPAYSRLWNALARAVRLSTPS